MIMCVCRHLGRNTFDFDILDLQQANNHVICMYPAMNHLSWINYPWCPPVNVSESTIKLSPFMMWMLFSILKKNHDKSCQCHFKWYRTPTKPTIFTMTSLWARWRLKLSASWSLAQSFVPAQITKNLKVPRHWPLWGDYTDDRWYP